MAQIPAFELCPDNDLLSNTWAVLVDCNFVTKNQSPRSSGGGCAAFAGSLMLDCASRFVGGCEPAPSQEMQLDCASRAPNRG